MVDIFPGADLFFNGKSRWTRSTRCGPLAVLVHDEPWPWPAEELTGAWPSGRSRARRLIDNGATERGGTGSPSRASPGRGRRCDERVITVKKWRWRHSVRVAAHQRRHNGERGALGVHLGPHWGVGGSVATERQR
jgi:hypothetical protein